MSLRPRSARTKNREDISVRYRFVRSTCVGGRSWSDDVASLLRRVEAVQWASPGQSLAFNSKP